MKTTRGLSTLSGGGLGETTPLTNTGLSKGQSARHVRWQRLAAENGAQTAEEAISLFRRECLANPWGPGSCRTALGSMIGALRRTKGPLREIFGGARLPQEVLDETRARDKACYEEAPRDLPALSAREAFATIERLKASKNLLAASFAAQMWATAGRAGCTLQLSAGNVFAEKGGCYDARFVRGKAVVARGGPFTVHTSVGPWWSLVRRSLPPKNGPIFPEGERAALKKDVRLAMRAVLGPNVPVDLRAWRRGSLQEMARAGVREKVLRHFSGHTNLPQLLRYLGWGRFWGEMAAQGRAAATHLWPETPAQ